MGALSGDTAGSVGTWKLFKGKVSQTIEDIKSSKSNIPTAPTITLSKGYLNIELDSDQESTSLIPSISDENTTEASSKQHRRKHSKLSPSSQHFGKELESDSDIESENFLEGDIERSRLRRSLANLKSKVKGKTTAHHHHHHHHHHQQHHHHPQATVALATAISSTAIKTAMAKEPNQQRNLPSIEIPSSSATTTMKTSFLRKRRKASVEKAEVASPTAMPEDTITDSGQTSKADKKKKKIIAGKKDFEIESGVEMLEDMTPQQDAIKNDVTLKGGTMPNWDEQLDSIIMDEVPIKIQNLNFDIIPTIKSDNLLTPESIPKFLRMSNILPISAIACISMVLMMPVHDFVRGALATFLGIITLDTVMRMVNDYIIANANEKRPFKIPDYSKMPILEIPAVEEHTIVKSYSGWMNEINSYDPQNYHINMTKSVYIKLEGTIMRISSTAARIPKKVLWNEPPIDIATVSFTDHRVFDLLDCRVELLPIGLARKRYFNRKYPIQLIIRKEHVKDLEDYSSGGKRSNQTTANNADVKESISTEAIPMTANTMESTNTTTETPVGDTQLDFASTVLNADLQTLHDTVHADAESKDLTVPRGDEVRLLLFSRGDREKEDWYRRFLAASTGEVHEQNLRLPNVKLIQNTDLQAMATKTALLMTNVKIKDGQQQYSTINLHSNDDKTVNPEIITPSMPDTSKDVELKFSPSTKISQSSENLLKSASTNKMQVQLSDIMPDYDDDGEIVEPIEDESFEGLIMSSCVSRNPIHYVRFMANYQRACTQSNIPVYREMSSRSQKLSRKHRRARRNENELWRGIDQSLFLGPSGSVVWANVLLGRVIYSCLHDNLLRAKLQDLLQRKLNSIKLPSFMENVIITQIHLGEVSPLVHRVSQPLLDERGTWLDADITYEGFSYIIVTTKLNLLRLKRQARPANDTIGNQTTSNSNPNATTNNLATGQTPPPPINIITSDLDVVSGVASNTEQSVLDASTSNFEKFADTFSSSAIFDSEAESSGGSSSESDGPVTGGPTVEGNASSEGNARRLFKLVDRFTASNLFQYATEISYVQRAMENMNANITLRVDLRGLVARGVINLPPPPSDRIWLAFRGPPRLWLTAKPTVGDKSVDWSVVTNVIESKLCEQVNRHLVYPNMVDVTIPFLGQPTYSKD